MEPEGFPLYNETLKARQNYVLLRLYLERQHEAELVTHLENERSRLSAKLTKKPVRKLFSHFRRELARKRSIGQGGHYVYKPLDEHDLLVMRYGPLKEEELAQRLAASDARNRMLEGLHQLDMMELAALITEFRKKGLVSDAQTDAILEKVGTQCEPLRQENARLKRELSVSGTNVELQTLRLVNEELQWKLDEQHNELAEARKSLAACGETREQLDMVERLNKELQQRPQEEVVQKQLLELIDMHGLVHERDTQIETLERDLAEARKQADAVRLARFDEESLELLLEEMRDTIARQNSELETLHMMLEESRRELRKGGDCTLDASFVSDLRQQVAEAADLLQVYKEAIETERELNDVTQLEVDQLHQLPVHRLDPRTLEPHETGSTLGELMRLKKPFFIVERIESAVRRGHAMSPDENSLRGALMQIAQYGTSRVRLRFEDESGRRQRELYVESLEPQKLAPYRPAELVLDFGQSQYQRLVYAGALPHRMIRPRGLIRAQRYDADRRVGEETMYRYELAGPGVSVVHFDDGAFLYATYVAASLYRLDLLVLPYR